MRVLFCLSRFYLVSSYSCTKYTCVCLFFEDGLSSRSFFAHLAWSGSWLGVCLRVRYVRWPACRCCERSKFWSRLSPWLKFLDGLRTLPLSSTSDSCTAVRRKIPAFDSYLLSFWESVTVEVTSLKTDRSALGPILFFFRRPRSRIICFSWPVSPL